MMISSAISRDDFSFDSRYTRFPLDYAILMLFARAAQALAAMRDLIQPD